MYAAFEPQLSLAGPQRVGLTRDTSAQHGFRSWSLPGVLRCLQLDTCTVKMWRSAALLLRAIWDAMPELRHLYADFVDRFEELERRRGK